MSFMGKNKKKKKKERKKRKHKTEAILQTKLKKDFKDGPHQKQK